MTVKKSDPHLVIDAAWDRAVFREQVIRRLAGFKRIPGIEMTAAMDELSLGRSQIHDLIGKYRRNPVASSLLEMSVGKKAGHSHLPSEIDALIEQMIQEEYLSAQKPSLASLCRQIAHECLLQGLQIPSRKAVTARIARTKASITTKARLGRKAAANIFRPVVHSHIADYALQIVQIDHTPVDQIVVDENTRQPIGRPWLTLAIDLASRMVMGFYLTMEAPSAVSVAMTLRQAVLSKDDWLADREIAAPWPAAGLPDILHMDNAKEFHSRALARGCGEYGIEQKFRPPATPHFGGHIERLIGTMMGEVHLLPGTTFSNVTKKGDYDAQARSAMTLKELERWLAIQIAGVYHARVHSGIKLPPNAAWDSALSRRPSQARQPPDSEKFLLDFLPFEYRTIRRDGIRLFNIRYWHPVLTSWIGEGVKLPVKYDPRDLSQVFVQLPDGDHWPVSYANLARPAISLWEHREAAACLREAGKAAVDESLIFAAIETQRSIVAEAKARTNKARRNATRVQHLIKTEPERTLVTTEKGPAAASSDDPYLPYALEDWS